MYTPEGERGYGEVSPVCGGRWGAGEDVGNLCTNSAVFAMNLYRFLKILKILFHNIIQAVFWYILTYTWQIIRPPSKRLWPRQGCWASSVFLLGVLIREQFAWVSVQGALVEAVSLVSSLMSLQGERIPFFPLPPQVNVRVFALLEIPSVT